MSKKITKKSQDQKVWKVARDTVDKIAETNCRHEAGRAVAGWVTDMLKDYYPPIVGGTYEESVVRSMYLAPTTPPAEEWEDRLIASGATPEHLWEEMDCGRMPGADLMQILNDFGDEYLAALDNFFNHIDALEEACHD